MDDERPLYTEINSVTELDPAIDKAAEMLSRLADVIGDSVLDNID